MDKQLCEWCLGALIKPQKCKKCEATLCTPCWNDEKGICPNHNLPKWAKK